MKMIKIIPVYLFVLLFSTSLPVMAVDQSLEDAIKWAQDFVKEKNNMMADSMGNKEKMMTDNMDETKMMTGTITAMLAGTDGHHAAGKVNFVQEMGHELLVLSDIKVDKVPDGHVYLAKQGDRKKGVELGTLKQFSGDVSFKLPEGTDLAAYDSVIIYCEKFDVEIGRAEFKEKM